MKELEIVRYAKIDGARMFFNVMDYRSSHFHEEWELLLVVNQPLTYMTSIERMTVHEGSLLVFPPYLSHEIEKASEKSCMFLCLQISPNLFPACPNLKSLMTNHINIEPFFSRDEYILVQKAMLDAMEVYLDMKDHDEFRFNALISWLLYQIFDHVPSKNMSMEELDSLQKKSQRLLRFKQYVDENYKYKIRLADFAKQENCSLSYMSSFIKESLNVTFRDYVTQMRYYAALHLMDKTSLGLMEICQECGFSDYRYFSSVFQEKTGLSPKEFRREPKKIEGGSIHVHQTIHSLERFYSETESRKILDFYRAAYIGNGIGQEGLPILDDRINAACKKKCN